MKGLFLQDYYIMKKNIFITFGICMYFLAILLIGSPCSKNSDIDFVMYGMYGIISCLLTSCACFTINFDKSLKSTLYTYCYPIKVSKIIAEKYAITYILFIISYVIITLFGLINSVTANYTPGKNFLFICFLVSSLILLFINFQLPITIRFGQTVASILLIVFIMSIIIAGLALIVKINTSPDLPKLLNQINSHKAIISILILIIDSLSITLSYMIAKRINR